ncbi:MAG: hypothetical protein ACTHMY_16220 [Solirubrobacteraceae bacterium]
MSNQTARRGQIALGLLWLIAGALQCQPYMFGKSFITGVLLLSAAGQPRFIGVPITWCAHVIEPHVGLFNGFAAIVEVLIGAGLLYRRTVRTAIALSLLWALGIWFGGEGFGMLFTWAASPLTGAPGAALLYVLAGLMCWPLNASTRPRQGRELGIIGERGARYAWAAIWLGCAVLWLLPANNNPGAIHAAIAGAPAGVDLLSRVLHFAAAATAAAGTPIAISLAAISVTVGLAVLYGWHPGVFVAMQISLSAIYWILGQGLGGIFTGRATDVGTAPVMILIALMMPRPAAQRTQAQSRHGLSSSDAGPVCAIRTAP